MEPDVKIVGRMPDFVAGCDQCDTALDRLYRAMTADPPGTSPPRAAGDADADEQDG